MGRKSSNGNDRARQMLAQETARIIVEQGIQDYRIAKNKAADRLGLKERGSLPGNTEIELAVTEHLLLFGRESHVNLLRMMRRAAPPRFRQWICCRHLRLASWDQCCTEPRPQIRP